MSFRWHLVHTFTGAEWHVQQQCLRPKPDGVLRCEEVYFPHYIGSHRRYRWSKGQTEPHFPGYLYARLGERQSCTDIAVISGVQHVVKSGYDYVVIPEPQIESLKARCALFPDRPLDEHAMSFRRPIKEGDWVIIPEGAFKGIPAVVEHVDNHGRVRVCAGKGLVFTFPASAFFDVAVSA